MSQHEAVLDVTYHEVARRILLGQEPNEIAEQMRIPHDRVEQILKRPKFKTLLEELRSNQYEEFDEALKAKTRDIQGEIEEECAASLDRLRTLAKEAASETVRMHIDQDFLDRGGFGKKSQEPTTLVQINQTDAIVIATALKKDKAGQERLKGEEELAKTPDKLNHPLLKEANEPSGDGSKGASSEPARESE